MAAKSPATGPRAGQANGKVLAVVLGAGPLLWGCSAAPIPRPDIMSAAHVAERRADEVSARADEKLPGVSAAVKAPLRDFNLLEDVVPVALVRAYQHPYDAEGLTSCKAVQDQVSALDLALGPDVDIPRAGGRSEGMMSKGRDFAAQGALDAVRSATTGAIPVRSWVRRLSGAAQDEAELKAVVLAAAVRRGFLKAVGLELHCAWPAAPLDLRSAQLKTTNLTDAEREALGGAPASSQPH